ncbi:MAG TPA: efflux RND transporter periplasmic adaptor subunit [Vicinamibacterales bacterium]|nr:efflux RND transporter periplasmic adaptor subunit [Vicinamibacterales bacterium]
MKQASLSLVLAAAMVAAGCGRHDQASPAEKAAAAAPPAANASTPAYFSVPADQMSHIQIVPVRSSAFETELKTTGTVDWDNDHTTQAITQVSGPITRILVDAGSRVTAGQPLLYVASPDVTAAFATYRKAQNKVDLAKRNLDRSRDLLEHKAIAQRDFDQVQADYNDAVTDLETASQALRILGVPPKEIEAAAQQSDTVRLELPMRSPITGTIVQKLVNPGQVIQVGSTNAFVISNVGTVWVQAHVYEQDLSRVRRGDSASVKAASYPASFQGKVTYVGNMLDPATRTTPVRIVTANPGGQLKKDQFVDVVIHDKTEHQALVVPTTAVLYDPENLPFVYVQVEPGKFAQRPVTLGAQHGDVTEIVKGLGESDRVVAQGSLFLQFANSYQG